MGLLLLVGCSTSKQHADLLRQLYALSHRETSCGVVAMVVWDKSTWY